ncbi:MAG: hypothetical protein PVF49_02125 [Anaerolineales bacterium]|jgi:hypothetical protein
MNSPRRSHRLLVLDALINLLLGGLLVWYPASLVTAFGLPSLGSRFFAMILGGVLVGIGIALLLEYRRGQDDLVGLGLGGAIAINLCGAIALAAALSLAELSLTSLGTGILWGLVVVLIGVSSLEWMSWRRAG